MKRIVLKFTLSLIFIPMIISSGAEVFKYVDNNKYFEFEKSFSLVKLDQDSILSQTEKLNQDTTSQKRNLVPKTLAKGNIKRENKKTGKKSLKQSGTGIASWYGGKFHGRLTASGKVYDKNKLTAAHKTIPFGTKLKITNPKTQKTVIVEITDRGPFVKNRILDLSQAAFEKIGNIKNGVMKVEYEVIK